MTTLRSIISQQWFSSSTPGALAPERWNFSAQPLPLQAESMSLLRTRRLCLRQIGEAAEVQRVRLLLLMRAHWKRKVKQQLCCLVLSRPTRTWTFPSMLPTTSTSTSPGPSAPQVSTQANTLCCRCLQLALFWSVSSRSRLDPLPLKSLVSLGLLCGLKLTYYHV